MIKITIRKHADSYIGFETLGHADYAEEQYDIICAAVSVLVINTLNSLETLTKDSFDFDEDSETGYMKCRFQTSLSDGGRLLMDAMVLGLAQICDNYGNKYTQLLFEEV